MKYRVFAALHEDASRGWVWLSQPRLERKIIRIINGSNRKSVFCEFREIDPNFRNVYNNGRLTIHLPSNGSEESLVMSQWYRRKLGIEKTQLLVDLEVKCTCCGLWASIRAGFQHPDAMVRMATYLAVMSSLLGVVSIVLGLYAAFSS